MLNVILYIFELLPAARDFLNGLPKRQHYFANTLILYVHWLDFNKYVSEAPNFTLLDKQFGTDK